MILQAKLEATRFYKSSVEFLQREILSHNFLYATLTHANLNSLECAIYSDIACVWHSHISSNSLLKLSSVKNKKRPVQISVKLWWIFISLTLRKQIQIRLQLLICYPTKHIGVQCTPRKSRPKEGNHYFFKPFVEKKTTNDETGSEILYCAIKNTMRSSEAAINNFFLLECNISRVKCTRKSFMENR